VLHRLNSAVTLIQRTTTEAPRQHMYYIGLDVHKKTISYCVKDVSGRIQQEGKVGSTRREQDCWMKTLPQPWISTVAYHPVGHCLFPALRLCTHDDYRHSVAGVLRHGHVVRAPAHRSVLACPS
jgi:hypothetical protein